MILLSNQGVWTMSDRKWLSLTDYSSKYRVSISTLRRRIKSEQIPYRSEDGKYFLADVPPAPDEDKVATNMQVLLKKTAHMQSLVESAPLRKPLLSQPRSIEAASFEESNSLLENLEARSSGDEPIISTATKLLNELKRAYTSVLQEKEEQLLQLKEEVIDLKTLVRVLEDDNQRMRKFLYTEPLEIQE
jgi:hypothetical protein